MIRLLGIVAVCLALASCAGTAALSPASNPGLASRGWEEARNYAGYLPSGSHINSLLVCKSPRCGGPGFVVTGTASMPADSTRGFQAIMANRSLSSAKLLKAAQLLTEGSPTLADMNGHVIGASKQSDRVVLTFTFSKSTPALGRVVGLARADVRASEMYLVVAGGPTMASARQRMGLIRN